MISNGQVFAGLAGHLALTGIPAIAAVLFAVRRGARSLPVLICIGLVASGTVAMGAFWAYYADPTIGKVWDFVVLFGSVEVAVWCVWKGGLDRETLRRLRVPLALWVLGSFFIAYLGFLHGGVDDPIPMSSTRFSGQLPSDNDIPRYFTEWFAANGHDGTPPLYPPDWLMSDRPPLQVGYALSQHAIVPTEGGLHYELLGIVIQQLWIPALWAVLVAARLRPTTRALAMFAAMVSDIGILYAFFVWPKLIAAAFLLAALALVISPSWREERRDPRLAILLGALLALSLLAHGASVFGVIPLVAIAAARGLPSWRWVGVALLSGFLLMAPWAAFQRFDDPPGNRLLKWQLGGDVELNAKGTLEGIADGYRKAGWDGTLENKLNNFEELAGLAPIDTNASPDVRVLNRATEAEEGIDALGRGELDEALGGFRGPRFFSLLPFLGLFLIAPFAMLLARARGRENEAEWRFALVCFAFAAIGCLASGLLLFGTIEARATIHVISLAIPIVALCGCVAGLRATYPRLAVGVVALNVLLVLVAYTPSLTPPPGTSYSPIAALLAALSLGGVGLVLFRDQLPARGGSRPG